MSAYTDLLSQNTGLRSMGATPEPTPYLQRLAENTAGRMQAISELGSGRQVDPNALRKLDEDGKSMGVELLDGLRRSAYNMSATTQAFMGQMAEPVAPDFAKKQLAGAMQTMRDMPASIAPTVANWDGVHDLRSFGQWASSSLGEGVGSMAPMVAGALLGAGGAKLMGRAAQAGSFIGGTAGMLPQEGGETALQLHQDPDALANTTPWSRAGLTLGRGAVNAALESIVPHAIGAEMLAGKGLAGRGLANAAATTARFIAGGAAGEYATEGAQELTGQAAMNIAKGTNEWDLNEAHNAGMAGAVTGGVMGGAGGVAHGVVNNLAGAGRDIADKLPDMPTLPTRQESVDAFVNGMQKFTERPEEFGSDVANATLDQIAKIPDAIKAARQGLGEGLDVGADVVMGLKERLDDYVLNNASPEQREWYADKTADFGNMTGFQYNELVRGLKEENPDAFQEAMGASAKMWSNVAKRGAGHVSDWVTKFTEGAKSALDNRVDDTPKMGKEAAFTSKFGNSDVFNQLERLSPEAAAHVIKTGGKELHKNGALDIIRGLMDNPGQLKNPVFRAALDDWQKNTKTSLPEIITSLQSSFNTVETAGITAAAAVKHLGKEGVDIAESGKFDRLIAEAKKLGPDTAMSAALKDAFAAYKSKDGKPQSVVSAFIDAAKYDTYAEIPEGYRARIEEVAGGEARAKSLIAGVRKAVDEDLFKLENGKLLPRGVNKANELYEQLLANENIHDNKARPFRQAGYSNTSSTHKLGEAGKTYGTTYEGDDSQAAYDATDTSSGGMVGSFGDAVEQAGIGFSERAEEQRVRAAARDRFGISTEAMPWPDKWRELITKDKSSSGFAGNVYGPDGEILEADPTEHVDTPFGAEQLTSSLENRSYSGADKTVSRYATDHRIGVELFDARYEDIAEKIYGEDRKTWPKNWRDDLTAENHPEHADLFKGVLSAQDIAKVIGYRDKDKADQRKTASYKHSQEELDAITGHTHKVNVNLHSLYATATHEDNRHIFEPHTGAYGESDGKTDHNRNTVISALSSLNSGGVEINPKLLGREGANIKLRAKIDPRVFLNKELVLYTDAAGEEVTLGDSTGENARARSPKLQKAWFDRNYPGDTPLTGIKANILNMTDDETQFAIFNGIGERFKGKNTIDVSAADFESAAYTYRLALEGKIIAKEDKDYAAEEITDIIEAYKSDPESFTKDMVDNITEYYELGDALVDRNDPLRLAAVSALDLIDRVPVDVDLRLKQARNLRNKFDDVVEQRNTFDYTANGTSEQYVNMHDEGWNAHIVDPFHKQHMREARESIRNEMREKLDKQRNAKAYAPVNIKPLKEQIAQKSAAEYAAVVRESDARIAYESKGKSAKDIKEITKREATHRAEWAEYFKLRDAAVLHEVLSKRKLGSFGESKTAMHGSGADRMDSELRKERSMLLDRIDAVGPSDAAEAVREIANTKLLNKSGRDAFLYYARAADNGPADVALKEFSTLASAMRDIFAKIDMVTDEASAEKLLNRFPKEKKNGWFSKKMLNPLKQRIVDRAAKLDDKHLTDISSITSWFEWVFSWIEKPSVNNSKQIAEDIAASEILSEPMKVQLVARLMEATLGTPVDQRTVVDELRRSVKMLPAIKPAPQLKRMSKDEIAHLNKEIAESKAELAEINKVFDSAWTVMVANSLDGRIAKARSAERAKYLADVAAGKPEDMARRVELGLVGGKNFSNAKKTDPGDAAVVSSISKLKPKPGKNVQPHTTAEYIDALNALVNAWKMAEPMAPEVHGAIEGNAGFLLDGIDGIDPLPRSGRDDSVSPNKKLATEVAETPETPAAPETPVVHTINEHVSSGYPARTAANAKRAGTTVAIAIKFNTGGEISTKKYARQNKKQFVEVLFDFKGDIVPLAKTLAAHISQAQDRILNVAGNGIKTLSEYKISQAEVNKFIYELIKQTHAITPISQIVSGGQTGADIAGAIAAKALGISSDMLFPAGFRQQNAAGKNYTNTAAGIEKQVNDGVTALTGAAPPSAPSDTNPPVNVHYGAGDNAILSNLAPRTFDFILANVAEKKTYYSVEHAYQTLKSGAFDAATYAKYKESAGVKISGLKPARTENEYNFRLMQRLMLRSFQANTKTSKAAKEALLATGGRQITHTQEKNLVWAEKFPELLMAVRKELQAAEAPKAPPETPATGAHHVDVPMHYKMSQKALRAELRGKYPNGVEAKAVLVFDGASTATTRSAPIGKVGDTFSLKAFPQVVYRITEVSKPDLSTDAAWAAWSALEGWDVTFVKQSPSLLRQAMNGVQTKFERVTPIEQNTPTASATAPARPPETPLNRAERGVQAAARDTVRVWRTKYGIKEKVDVIFTHSLDVNGMCYCYPDTGGTVTLYIKPGLSDGQTATVLAHEFGHLLQFDAYAEATPEEQQALIDSYLRDRETVLNGTIGDYARLFSTPASAMSRGVYKATEAKDDKYEQAGGGAQFIELADQQYFDKRGYKFQTAFPIPGLVSESYRLSFDEWFANQFARHAVKDFVIGETNKTETKFWERAVAAVRAFFMEYAATLSPTKSFEVWVTALAESNKKSRSSSAFVGPPAPTTTPPAAAAPFVGSADAFTPTQRAFINKVEKMLGKRVEVRFGANSPTGKTTASDLRGGVAGSYENIDAALKRLREAAALDPTDKELQAELEGLEARTEGSIGGALKQIRDRRRLAIRELKQQPDKRTSERTDAQLHKAILDAEKDEATVLKDKAILGIIHVAAGAEDQAGLAEHEAFHAAFSFFFTPEERRALGTAFSQGLVKRRLLDYFKDYPDVVKAINEDPEEAAAYGYQLWALNPSALKLGALVDSFFNRFKAWLRKVFGILTAEDKAKIILDNFKSGKRAEQGTISPLQIRLDEERPWFTRAMEMSKDIGGLVMSGYDMLMTPAYQRIVDLENPALTAIAKAGYQQTGEEGGAGMIQRQRQEGKAYINRIAAVMDKLKASEMKELQDALVFDHKPLSQKLSSAKKTINSILQDLLRYQQDAGVEIKDASGNGNYYPLTWDAELVASKKKEFLKMLEKYEDELHTSGKTANELYESISGYLLRGENLTEIIGDDNEPINEHAKTRTLAFISKEDRRAFMSDDPVHTMMHYVKQSVRQAEFVRSYGDGAGKLIKWRDEAKKTYGATQSDILLVNDYIDGLMGNKEAGMSRELKDLYGFMNVYQNYRLLSFSLFSSLVDPMGIAIRSNDPMAAWEAFTYSMGHILRDFRSKGYTRDQWEQIAEDWGIIESSGTTINTDAMYDGVTMRGTTKKLNDALFKYNLLNGWIKSNTIMATKAAQVFIRRAAEGKVFKEADSKRYLDELGLTKGDVIYSKPLNRILLRASELVYAGKSPAEAAAIEKRLRAATEQFVRQALLSPSAAELPSWASNPYLAPIAHLKTFVWAFNQTIIRRVAHELENGNYKPIMMAAAYVPLMIGADWLKDMLSGFGALPAHKKNWGLYDYVRNGIDRSGFTGTTAFINDAKEDMMRGGSGIESFSGPMLGQLKKAIHALSTGSSTELQNWMVKAVPLNQVFDSILAPKYVPLSDE